MYFHVSHREYAVGDAIQPGNWGRIIRQFRPGGPMPSNTDFHIVLWEVAMEASRVAIDGGLPSRLECIFVTETIEAATSFRDRYRRGAFIYEALPILDCISFRGDFALISNGLRSGAYADYMAEYCRQYWTSPATIEPEVLYAGPLLVSGRS